MRTCALLATATGLLAAGGCGTLPTTPGPARPPAAATPTATRVGLPAPSTVPGYPYAEPADVCGRFTAALFSAASTVCCTLTRHGNRWRVAGYTLAPLDGTP